MTGYDFAKRIVDYFGANKEHGAGDVFFETAKGRWCDWFVCRDSFYESNCIDSENKDRFTGIIRDIFALYNTRGGVVLIGISDDGSPVAGHKDPKHFLNKGGLVDYAGWSCDDMCKYNGEIKTKKERRTVKKLYEIKIVSHQGADVIAILVKSANEGLRYPNDCDRYYVRDANRGRTVELESVRTANAVDGGGWDRRDYINNTDLADALDAMHLPGRPIPRVPFAKAIWRALKFVCCGGFCATLIRLSRFGFVMMTLIGFHPIGKEVFRGDGTFGLFQVFKMIVIGCTPFVAPHWAARGMACTWGMDSIEAHLCFYWPYILYLCGGLFWVLGGITVKRRTIVRAGKVALVLVVVMLAMGAYTGYLFYLRRISSIGGYHVLSGENPLPAIGMNELIVRSMQGAVEKCLETYYDALPHDLLGPIRNDEGEGRLKQLKLLEREIDRVRSMYKPKNGRRTKLVDTLGEPDQGLIDHLAELHSVVNKLVMSYTNVQNGCKENRAADIKRDWNRANIVYRNFLRRANELKITCH